MTLKIAISGTYLDPMAQPMPGITLTFESLYNSSQTQLKTTVEVNVEKDGSYYVELVPNYYNVCELDITGRVKWLGNIQLFADSPPGTLNEYLTSFQPNQMRPGILTEMEVILEETKQAAANLGAVVTIDNIPVDSDGHVELAKNTGYFITPSKVTTFTPKLDCMVEAAYIYLDGYDFEIDLIGLEEANNKGTLDPGYSLKIAIGTNKTRNVKFLTSGHLHWIDGSYVGNPVMAIVRGNFYLLQIMAISGTSPFVLQLSPPL
ncbi:MAG: prophage tail fiber N-terminal domain-containing protein [Leclercia adecarboxylata]|nr:prophage tail fiber N-terminal domain-containing protein [Leclercia adecarboxylata]MDU1082760.1 prophage tail fiber N-terminal domain-containing protein [Leclercia adecarboxylata]